MEKVALALPCGRTIMVQPKVAELARRKEAKNRDNARRIARELKEGHFLPRSYNFGARVQSGSFVQSKREIDSRESWQGEKKANVESNWQKHLAASGL